MGELYDLASPYVKRADLAFYLEEAEKSRGKVLEVACGTGRVLLPIARKGISITGIDQSPFMLERCHELLALGRLTFWRAQAPVIAARRRR